MLRVLGLSNDARVHISAPGIDVVITGDPQQVRSLLSVVRNELERGARRNQLKAPQGSQVVQPTELDEMDSPYAIPEAEPMVKPVDQSTDPPKPPPPPPASVVRAPSSPIEERMTAAPPEPRARPVGADDVQVTAAPERSPEASTVEAGTEDAIPLARPPHRPEAHAEESTAEMDNDEPATLLPDLRKTRDDPLLRSQADQSAVSGRPVVTIADELDSGPGTALEDEVFDDGPDQEITALSQNPSGPVPQPSVSEERQREEVTAISKQGPRIDPDSTPFVTDGGPTLAPNDSQMEQSERKDLRGTDPDLMEVSESDIREL